jgi:hypothetical protein
MTMEIALLRLFNAVRVDNKQKREIPQSVLFRTIKRGYILQETIQSTIELLDTIESIVGISGIKANATFHKCWQTIQDTPQETLWIQAITHYFTTYGFEALGIYRENTVYIPSEELNLSDIKDDIPLIVIKAMDEEEILNGIIRLGSGIALAQETLNDIMAIVEFSNFDNHFVEEIKNRELKALLYDYYGFVPSEPVEFLRHLISKLTD